jgi:serine/threonine protein kinase
LNLRGRLPFSECIELGMKLTTALDHLHQGGLVHRDIKPSNIIFVSGSSKLADIGLVTTQDATISFVGTIGYLPPEGPGTPQADLYSLGKVLYEASTGKDRSAYPEPATELGTDADIGALAELNEIILKACAPTVRDRYQSAQEMKVDLLLLQSGKSIKRLRRLERRLAVFNREGLAVVVLAILAVGAFLYQRRQSRQLAHMANESRERAVRLSVAQGSQRMENGDYFNSLVWFTEALRLAAGNTREEGIHRHRIEAVRRHCPKLVAFGVHSGPIFTPSSVRMGAGF